MTASINHITRRRFLAYALAAGAAGAGGLIPLIARWLKDTSTSWQLIPLNDGTTRVDLPPLESLETGAVPTQVMAGLQAVVDVIVGDDGPVGHYETFFRWRAQNLPGHLALYTTFTRALDDATRAATAQTFTNASRDTRRRVLQRAFDLPDPDSSIFETRVPDVIAQNLDEAEVLWLYFNRDILAPLLLLYSQTNAWIMLGYEGWPSQARGLNGYVQPAPGQV